jgi:broad specificity phosphatase PhoE
MLPVNLFIIRHGESIGNLAKRRSEGGDHALITKLHGTHTSKWPLTKKGEEQAKKAGVFLSQLLYEKELHLDRAYSSSFVRAMQTSGHLGLFGAQWRTEDRITERDWGELDKLTDEERKERFADALHMREVEPFFWEPPGGEGFNSLVLRVRDFIASLARVKVENAVVVCHGEVTKAFRVVFMHLKPWEYAKMEFSKESLDRVHNCQIDHYSRRNPKTFQLSTRLEWFQAYRPAEDQDIVIPWKNLPQELLSNQDLLSTAGELSSDFSELR